MTRGQSKGTFWTLTLTSAKEAVVLYFEPLSRITAWLLRIPKKLRAEHRRQQMELAQGLDELEQRLELERAQKDAWAREHTWRQERAKALAQELKLQREQALEVVSVLAEGGEEGLEKWRKHLMAELRLQEILGGGEQELEELRMRVHALGARQGWKQVLEDMLAQRQGRMLGQEEFPVWERVLEQVRRLSQELKRTPEDALTILTELERSWGQEQMEEWKQVQALPEQMPVRVMALRRVAVLDWVSEVLRVVVLLQAKKLELTPPQMLEKVAMMEQMLEQELGHKRRQALDLWQVDEQGTRDR